MISNKRGISLIVLVITIIVMVILASAVIISLNNTDIIGIANNTVSESNLKEVQQLASLAWSEAYIDKLEDDNVNLEQRVKDALIANKVNLDNYMVTLAKGGVKIETARTGTLGSLITSANDYGKTINYTANGVTDWKVYYETNDYVYLIASEALSHSSLPTNLPGVNIINEKRLEDMGYDLTSGTPYYLEFDNTVTFTNNIQRPDLWMANFNDGDYSINNAFLKAAWFLDETLWTDFVNQTDYKDDSGNSYVVGAVGASTLEMFAASWNAKRAATNDLATYNPDITLTAIDGWGYEINSDSYINISMADKLYLGEKGYNFKLASCIAYGEYDELDEMKVYSQSIICRRDMTDYFGFINMGGPASEFFELRPIICLKSSIPARLVADSRYVI